jgi:hypothetical protein
MFAAFVTTYPQSLVRRGVPRVATGSWIQAGKRAAGGTSLSQWVRDSCTRSPIIAWVGAVSSYRLSFSCCLATASTWRSPGPKARCSLDSASAWQPSVAVGSGVCGLAATFNLTALGVWPLLLLPRADGRGLGPLVLGVWSALLLWSSLTPPSWFAYGPLYLYFMAESLARETPSHLFDTAGALNLRYTWPFGLALLLAVAWVIPLMPHGNSVRAKLRGSWSWTGR